MPTTDTDLDLHRYLKKCLGDLVIHDRVTGEEKRVDIGKRKMVRFEQRETLDSLISLSNSLNVESISRIYLAIQSEAQFLLKNSLYLSNVYTACNITRFKNQAEAHQWYNENSKQQDCLPPDTRVAGIQFKKTDPADSHIVLMDDSHLGWEPSSNHSVVSFSECLLSPSKDLFGDGDGEYGNRRSDLVLMVSLVRAYNAMLLGWHMRKFTAYRLLEQSNRQET